jgi:opacity protein-like surface antigen
LFVAVPAAANEPATANSVQIGLGFRYGFELEEGDFNPWGTGLGIAAGYTLPNALYLGANFDYFFGETIEVSGGEQSGNIWQLMAEAGYDLGLGSNFVIRPKVGLGLASFNGELCIDPAPCIEESETDFAMAPGATFLLITENFSLTFDFRYDMIFAEEQLNALIFSAGIGF